MLRALNRHPTAALQVHAKLGPGAGAALAPIMYIYLLLSCTAYLMIAADCLCPLLAAAGGPDAWWAGRQAVVAAVGLGVALPLSLPRTLGAVAGAGDVYGGVFRVILGSVGAVESCTSLPVVHIAAHPALPALPAPASPHHLLLSSCSQPPCYLSGLPPACRTGVSTFKVYAIAFVVGAVVWRALGAVGSPDFSWAAVHASTLDPSSPDCWQGLAIALPILAFGFQVGRG